MASGTLIAESLRLGAALDELPLTVGEIVRRTVGGQPAGQPDVWTFVEFTIDDADANRLATALARVLEPAAGWYCDFRTERETFVVYADRIFHYPRGDDRGRAEAADYGRSVGVPEAELDWPE